MPTPITDPNTEEGIQFNATPSPPVPGFWACLSGLSEEKMEAIEDDGDQFFDEADEAEADINDDEQMDKEATEEDPKRVRDPSSPPRASKKPRDATTGAPSPNSRDANDNEILEDADNAQEPPPEPEKVDISMAPH
jgi:hypothetical protein